MEGSISFFIIYVIPGATIISFVCFFGLLIFRRKIVRAFGLWLSFIAFLLDLIMVLLLLAHPYMIYALISTGISFVAFIYIFFYRIPNN